MFLTYPRDHAYVAANRSPVASILGIIRAGQKTRLVRALWRMFHAMLDLQPDTCASPQSKQHF
jgi:hypothetical protein